MTLISTTGLPAWFGPLIVILLVLPTVISGGMRSVTVAQAVQYWFKLSALFIPTVFIVLRLGAGEAELLPDLADAFEVALVADTHTSTSSTFSLVDAQIHRPRRSSHGFVRYV